MMFTHDETNLICIYSTGSRTALIANLQNMMTHLTPEEPELRDLTEQTLEKLRCMTDDAFSRLELFPDFNEEK